MNGITQVRQFLGSPCSTASLTIGASSEPHGDDWPASNVLTRGCDTWGSTKPRANFFLAKWSDPNKHLTFDLGGVLCIENILIQNSPNDNQHT